MNAEGTIALAVLAADALQALERVDPAGAAEVVGRSHPPPGITDVAMVAANAAPGRLADTVCRLRGLADRLPRRPTR